MQIYLILALLHNNLIRTQRSGQCLSCLLCIHGRLNADSGFDSYPNTLLYSRAGRAGPRSCSLVCLDWAAPSPSIGVGVEFEALQAVAQKDV